jgi:dihydropteroate synthase
MVEEGADMIDVGGESSRPGSGRISESDELRRVLPVLEALASRVNVPISIDTLKPGVARRCLESGACIVNDIRGLRDAQMLSVAAAAQASVVIMHMRGEPATMQRNTTYVDVVGEIRSFLKTQSALAKQAGIREIAVDPGLGFGKSARQNFEILARLAEFRALGYPILVGPSRKSFLGSLASRLPVEERLEGTLAAVATAVTNGAGVVRVHDVRECRRVVDVVHAIREAGDAG